MAAASAISKADVNHPGYDINLPSRLGIVVRWGAVPTELPGGRWFGEWLCVLGPRALVVSPNGYRALIEQGSRVTVAAPESWRSIDDPRWLIEGQVVWLAMAQRKTVCLHASIVELNGRAVGIAGDSGAGKSTTAVYLAAHGHRLLVDDVAPVVRAESGSEDGRVTVQPYPRRVHLTRAAANLLGLEFAELLPMAKGGYKASLEPANPGQDEVQVEELFFLVSTIDATDLTIQHPRGMTKMNYLHRVAGWNGLAPTIMGSDHYLRELAALAERMPVTVVKRPANRSTIADVAAVIQARRPRTS